MVERPWLPRLLHRLFPANVKVLRWHVILLDGQGIPVPGEHTEAQGEMANSPHLLDAQAAAGLACLLADASNGLRSQ